MALLPGQTGFLSDDSRIGSVDIDTWRAVPSTRNPSGSRTGEWLVVAGDSDEWDVVVEVTAAEYPRDVAEFIVCAVRNEYVRVTRGES